VTLIIICRNFNAFDFVEIAVFSEWTVFLAPFVHTRTNDIMPVRPFAC